ncbi:MAG: hypothetical protein ACKO2P_06000 [Planctomycetota bacterium]
MKLQIFHLPTDPNLIPDWLEQQIVGTSLAQLIAELHAVHGGLQNKKLQEISGNSHPSLLQTGLRALSPAQIQQLLQNPATLGELQEEVFVGGYLYWTRLAESGRASSLADLLLQRRFLPHSILESPTDAGLSSRTAQEMATLTEPIPQGQSSPERPEMAVIPPNPQPGPVSPPRNSSRRGRLLLLLAPAVIAAVAVLLILPRNSSMNAWGFQRENLLTAQVSESELFSSLTLASADWFNQDRSTLPALRQALQEFSVGCNVLITAPLPQLSPEKRRLLQEKCRNWQREADSLLAQLDAPNAPLSELRTSSDALMTRLGNALRRQLTPQA